MSWELRLTTWEDYKRLRDAAITDAERRALVGFCWYANDGLQASLEAKKDGRKLSANYRADWLGKRKAIFIAMPMLEADNCGFQTWSPDCLPTEGDGQGWKVTGELPRITATPSINIPGQYHGWVTDGVLTDDCEGRLYNQELRR